MGLKPGYKLTEVGIIPVNWEVTRLGFHGETYGGLTGKTKKDFGSGNAHYVTFMNVMSNVIVDPDCFERVHVAITESQNLVQRSDLLFNGSSETPDEVALCAVVLHDVTELYLNSFCFGYRLHADKSIDPIFLSYLFRSQAGRKLVKALAQGSTRYNISKGALLGAQLALPPLHEQRVIATSLTDIDALLESLDRLIAKKRDLKQAAMQQLLTGQARLPGFSGKWDTKTLFEIAAHKKELFDDGDWIESEHITSEGIRLIQTGNIGIGRYLEKDEKKYITEASFNSLRCKELEVGDLLVCRLADPAGRACVLGDIGEKRIVTSVDVTIFRPLPSIANREFLSQVFSTSDWFKQVSERSGGTTHKRISRGALGRLSINLPPINEQIAIATVLTDMEMELLALDRQREKAHTLKQGMMQELLTGSTRLI